MDKWASLIDQANMSGQEDLRKLYIQLRDAGADPSIAENQAVTLDNGYSYNPFAGLLTHSSGDNQDYAYSSKENYTDFNGTRFKGYFDPNVLGSLTESDIAKAYDNQKQWYDTAQSQYGNWLDSKYLQTLNKFHGSDTVGIDEQKFLEQVGVTKDMKELAQEYNQRALENAYTDAYNRMNPNAQAKDKTQIFNQGILGQLKQNDWTDWMKGFTTPKATPENLDQGYNEQLKFLRDNPQANPAVQQALIEGLNQKFGKPSSTPQTTKTPTAPTLPTSTVQPTQPAQPSTPAQPSLPAQAPNNPEQLDWKGLYDNLSNVIKGINDNFSKPKTTPTINRPQLVQSYDYGINAASRQQSRSTVPYYTGTNIYGSTQYSGKGI